MTISQNVDPLVYNALTKEDYEAITDYMQDPMSATTINDKNLPKSGGGGRNGQTVTSELVYYWMTALNIPFECQKWHLNRLLTLIHICSIKNTPAKKMTKKETAANYAAINKARRAKYHTSG
jgi:hypothetical protein